MTYLNMICCLPSTLMEDHSGKAASALLTAWLNSDSLVSGTLVRTVCVTWRRGEAGRQRADAERREVLCTHRIWHLDPTIRLRVNELPVDVVLRRTTTRRRPSPLGLNVLCPRSSQRSKRGGRGA